MKKLTIVSVIVVVLVLAGGAYYSLFVKSITCSAETAKKIPSGQTLVISYKNDIFSPDCALVSPHTNITWTNNSTADIQIGADPHPIHTGNKEVSDGQFVLTVKPGASQTATISKSGKNGYHNHLNPFAKGVIIVQ